jgi:competence protein ComEC
MVGFRILKLPAVYAALGASISFYLYPLISGSSRGIVFLFPLLFLLAGLTAFLRVLTEAPFLFYAKTGTAGVPRPVREAGLLASAAVAGFCLGFSAGALAPSGPAPGLPPERVRAVSGILAEDPRSFNDGRGMGAVMLSRAAGEGGIRVSAGGKITVFFPPEVIPRLREFGRGCELFIEGGLVRSGSGAYAGSLLFRASAVHVTKPASGIEQIRTALRETVMGKFGPSSDKAAPVWGPLASALLLGVRDNLDSDLAAGFRNSGCAHVLALSGMHLALLSGVIAFFLRRFLGPRPAALAGGVFVIAYVFAAGAQASLVRAAIMYLLGAACVWGFLKRSALALLCIAFIIQLFFQSGAAASPSFILSYLALAGILTVGETVKALFRGRIPEIAGTSLAASVGAFIVTAPAVSYFFGILRPVGILAGLVIVPVVSVFMILVLAGLVLSFAAPALFSPVSQALTLLYRLLELMVSAAGRVPGFAAPYPAVLAGAFAAAALLACLQNRDSLKRNKIVSFAV